MLVRATTRILVKGQEHQKDEVFEYDGPGHICLIPVTGKPAAEKPPAGAAARKPAAGKPAAGKPKAGKPVDAAFE